MLLNILYSLNKLCISRTFKKVKRKFTNFYFINAIRKKQNQQYKYPSIILFNARSITNRPKWKRICSKRSIYNPSIIAITETWLRDELCQCFTFNNYQQIAKCCSGGRDGGVLMFSASHFKVVLIVLPVDAPPSCDVLCVKNVLTKLCRLLLYRPHHSISVEETRQLHKATEALLAAYH